MRRQNLWIPALLVFLLEMIWLTWAPHGGCQTSGKEFLPKITPEEAVPIHIHADAVTYDRKADQYIAEGNVEIKREGMTLRADRVVLDNRTRVATAEGKVEIVQAGDRLQGDLIEMNIDDQTGRILKGTLFFERYNLTVRGDEIQRMAEDRYRVVGATLTTCSGDVPDWRFAAKEIDLTVEGLAKVRQATFQVRNVPVMYLPYLSYPALIKRKTGFLIPEYRSSSRFGHGFSVPFFWAFHQSYDATFTQTYFTERGYQQGVELRYAPREWLDGFAYGEYIRDQQDVDPEIDHRGGAPRKREDRWRFRLEQEAALPRGVVSRAFVDTVSDNYYLEDFSKDHDERYLRYLTSTLNATKRWKAYLVAGEAEYYRNLDAPGDDNGRTPAKLPSILFHRTQVPVFDLPVSFGWDTTFEHFWREKGGKGEVIGFDPGVSLPIHLGPHFTFIPFARWQERLIITQDHARADETARRSLYHYGASLSTELARIFPFSGRGRILSVKHTLQPEFRLDVTGHSSDGDWPEDLLEPVSHDRLVSFILTQFLTSKMLGRKEQVRFRELGRLRIEQAYSLREEGEPVLPIRANLELRLLEGGEGRSKSRIRRGPWEEPRRFLFADLEGFFDWYDHLWEDMSITLRGGDDRGDEIAVSYRRVKPIEGRDDYGKQVGGSFRIRIFPTLDLMGQGRYDYESNEWIRYGYGLELHPACWAVRFTHTIEPGFGGLERDHDIRFQMFLLGLGRIMKF